jgi:membrane-bound metal-dependent hydrolase YbcI (DUF457 family)
MANFDTHLSFAAAVSGMISLGCMVGGIATPKDVITIFILGSLGGILPDVDSDNSMPTQMIFTLLGIAAAFFIVFDRGTTLSLLELLSLWVASYTGVKYGLGGIFNRYTTHRGIFHSLLAALFFTLMGVGISFYFFQQEGTSAWLIGLALGAGYLTHLALDEIFSVNVMGVRFKNSFGTAMKIFPRKNIIGSILMGTVTIALLVVCPSPSPLVENVTSEKTLRQFRDKIWLYSPKSSL